VFDEARFDRTVLLELSLKGSFGAGHLVGCALSRLVECGETRRQRITPRFDGAYHFIVLLDDQQCL
jgi:hypothetical protein